MEQAKVIDGRGPAAELRASIAARVEGLLAEGGKAPGLAAVLIGDDPASRVYAGQKEKSCRGVGFKFSFYELPAEAGTGMLVDLLGGLSEDPDVHGILVEFPVPGHIDWATAVMAMSAEKDVDGVHPLNLGRLMMGLGTVVPCTPRGAMYLLKKYGIDPAGKRAVVLGRSNIVGKPMALLLQAADATVTVCHSRTTGLQSITREADIVVAAIGKPEYLKGPMVKPGCVVIDVGINQTERGLVGDVDHHGVSPVASWITPVPGGVGPMTTAMFLLNTLERYLALEGIQM